MIFQYSFYTFKVTYCLGKNKIYMPIAIRHLTTLTNYRKASLPKISDRVGYKRFISTFPRYQKTEKYILKFKLSDFANFFLY